MKFTGKLAWAMALCATLAIVAAGRAENAWAQSPDSGAWHHHRAEMHGHFGGADGGFMAALHQLNLTDTQKQSMRSVLAAARTSMRAARTPDQAIRAFATALPDDPNYAQVVADAVQHSQQLVARHIQQMSDVRTQLYSLLTAEQKKQLPAILSKIATERQQKWQQRAPDASS